MEIFAVETFKHEQYDFNEIDMANIEGNGTRGDIDGRGSRRDVVGNTVILREERPRLIRDFEMMCKAIERALGALTNEERTVIEECFIQQQRDKHIYKFIMKVPKSTYDFFKARAIDRVTFILKTAAVI